MEREPTATCFCHKCQTPLHKHLLRTCCTTPPTDKLTTSCSVYKSVAGVRVVEFGTNSCCLPYDRKVSGDFQKTNTVPKRIHTTINISHGSVATHVSCGEIFFNGYLLRISAECVSEITLKIGQYLVKIYTTCVVLFDACVRSKIDRKYVDCSTPLPLRSGYVKFMIRWGLSGRVFEEYRHDER